jgi:plastocyanin
MSIIRLGVLALAALAAACGGAATPPAPATAAATVVYSGFSVAPASVEVKAGEAVGWSNRDGTTHTVTAGKPGSKSGAFEQRVASNASVTVTFAAAGTFEYFCELHPTMVGTVVVR